MGERRSMLEMLSWLCGHNQPQQLVKTPSADASRLVAVLELGLSNANVSRQYFAARCPNVTRDDSEIVAIDSFQDGVAHRRQRHTPAPAAVNNGTTAGEILFSKMAGRRFC
jgi:hypothetical protein